MALKDAILAALADGESSGYDLAKAFDKSVANFWTATPQQLYRELDKLEAAGLVEARLVEQQRRPNKRVFSLTPAGRTELHDFTTRPPKPTAIRDELLVAVSVLDAGDPVAIRAAVLATQAASEVKLKRYERGREHLLAGRSETEFLRDAERIGPYLTLVRGIAFERENLRWGEFVLRALDRRRAGAVDG